MAGVERSVARIDDLARSDHPESTTSVHLIHEGQQPYLDQFRQGLPGGYARRPWTKDLCVRPVHVTDAVIVTMGDRDQGRDVAEDVLSGQLTAPIAGHSPLPPSG
jgi:hypothetical protein